MLFYILKEKGNLKKAYKMYKASKKINQLDLFDENFYLKNNPDVRDAKGSPLQHYLYHGYKEGRRPGKHFDNNYYLKNNPDVKKSGENPLVHYVLHGKREGRYPVKPMDKENAKEIKRLKRIVRNQNKALDSYNQLFNDLYIFHETTPKGALKDMQDLCLEIMIFLDNICKKYDIEYWLDYGSLLGPVRHGGFLPWDDDFDLGMMKHNFDKLMEVTKKEIKENDLEGYLFIKDMKKYDNTVTGFIQLISQSPELPNMLAAVDILPYEYLKNDENLEKQELKQKISDQIEITQKEFLEKEYFKTNPIEANKKLNEIVGIVDHEDEYIIPSSINLRPGRIRIYKTEEMFPLQNFQFGEHYFLAAKEERTYLEMSYGEDFMKMPRNIKIHTRIHTLMKKDVDLHQLFVDEIERLRSVNEKFNQY